MKTKSRSSKLKLEPLIPLDLKKCRTVSEIVGGMSHCAFGARMLGEVCAMLFDWTNRNGKPYVIRDHLDLANEKLLGVMYQHGWFQGPYTSLEFIDHCRRAGFKERKALVLGNYHEGTADELYRCANEAIFVNQHGFARPGQIQDGFFPNAVFIDPNLALPIFFAVLKERKGFGKVSVPELFLRLKQHAGLAHDLVAGGETLLAMYRDKHCVRFLTLAGAMTIAKMQLLICDMIDNCLVDHISSTGALMAHGLIEGIGDRHYKHNPENDDKLLAARGINRVTDSLEPETNFDHLDDVMDGVLDGFTGTRDIAPSEIHARIGQYLREHHPTCRGVLRSAYDKRVPVCVPAFVDSEIGNDVCVHNMHRKKRGDKLLVVNPELDTHTLVNLAVSGQRIGIFSIGGGVPRNNTQNLAPLIEIARNRNAAKWPMRKFRYGCRIDPAPLWYGNLGGATYNEGGSWRKMDLEHGMFAELRTDATIAWPFLLKYVLETF